MTTLSQGVCSITDSWQQRMLYKRASGAHAWHSMELQKKTFQASVKKGTTLVKEKLKLMDGGSILRSHQTFHYDTVTEGRKFFSMNYFWARKDLITITPKVAISL